MRQDGICGDFGKVVSVSPSSLVCQVASINGSHLYGMANGWILLAGWVSASTCVISS